jgi:hypothetical protein
VIDARDLAGDVTARVEALFRAWGKGRPAAPLTKKWVKRLGQQVLAPHFSLTLALGSALGWEEKALALLHEEQDVCLDFLDLNPRALVRGGAGTGKTVVAVERARRLASAGNDVLLLCFNRPLAHHLRAVSTSWEGLAGKVWAGSYHQLGAELCARAGVAWNEPPNDLSEATRLFWNETSGVLLLEAAAKLGEKWDALVVDEAQDFPTEWWAVLGALMRGGEGAPTALFADPEQDLWERASAFSASLPVFPLRTNCRSTTAIAGFLGRLTGAPEGARPRVSPWAVPGEEPRVVRWKDAAEERAKAGELVAQLLLKEGVGLERVAIVGMRRLEKSCLAGKAELAGFPVAAIGDDGGTGVPGAIRIQRRHRYGARGRRRPPPRRGRERVGDEAPQPLRRRVPRAVAPARLREERGGAAGAGLRDLVDRRPEQGRGNRPPLGPRRLEPEGLGLQDLGEGGLRGIAERGAVCEVGDVRDVARVLVTREDVDVVVRHSASPITRLCRSTSRSYCLTW